MARIPGKMKKRIWIREGDVVIIIPWDFQNEKADVVWRYTGPQVDWLQRKGFLKGTTSKDAAKMKISILASMFCARG
jgi:translation initiation factor 1A